MSCLMSNNSTPYRIFVYRDGKTSIVTARSGERGAVETVFRYFRLVVERMSGPEGTIQFSGLQFITPDGIDVFKYAPSGGSIQDYVKYAMNRGRIGSSGEEPTYGLIGTGNKCCLTGIGVSSSQPYQVQPPLIVKYDLLSKRLDLSVYGKWRWYTSNDTARYQGRNMVKFRIDVSNTGENWNNAADADDWLTVSEADFTGAIPPEFRKDKTLAFTGDITGLERKRK